MSPSMYTISAPVLAHMLENLTAVLKKGVAHAEAHKIDPAVLFSARLYPNMFPLVRQVQIATDQAKGCVSRLAGQEPPKFEDNEKTFEELFARLDRTIAHVKSFKPEQLDSAETRRIELKTGGQMRSFDALPYVLNHVYPNFYFHVTTAYAILRHNGVEIGKGDFMGQY
ncbi:MAG TPA: DUF1993 domain-containing protein [Gammaproteobacteria bacterium]|nr:DUF1993 domain-containing protein [Gammaproteobacteria bacterium]